MKIKDNEGICGTLRSNLLQTIVCYSIFVPVTLNNLFLITKKS